ncbi:flocculation protein FLO11 [Biomphalaria glabrata]|nr:flocculation protein FLO11 [Biomphalaria glabrata]
MRHAIHTWRLSTLFCILFPVVVVKSSFQGSEFLLAFPSSRPTNSSFQQRLSLANSDEVLVTVNVTLVKNLTALWFGQISLGVGQGCFSDCFNESLASSSSRLGGVLARISSSGRIVVLAHSVSAGSDYDSFLAVPTANLSQTYKALAECPSGSCLLVVASAAAKVNVTITFCLSSKNKTPLASFSYNKTYFNGSSLTVTLNSWDTLEIITDSVNLSGSVIQSSGKVAVFSGTLTLSNNVINDFNIEQVAPTNLLGTEYVVVDCPTPGSSTDVKIVYTESNTSLNIDTNVLTLKTNNDCIEYYSFKQHGAAVIKSNKPVIVQLMYSGDNLVMTPTQNWGSYYVTVPSSPCKVILTTRSNCSSGFSFNGVLENGLSWTPIGDGSFKFAVKALSEYGTWVNISVINCTFSGIVNSPLKSSMLWSLGWGPDYVPPSLTTTSTTAAQTSITRVSTAGAASTTKAPTSTTTVASSTSQTDSTTTTISLTTSSNTTSTTSSTNDLTTTSPDTTSTSTSPNTTSTSTFANTTSTTTSRNTTSTTTSPNTTSSTVSPNTTSTTVSPNTTSTTTTPNTTSTTVSPNTTSTTTSPNTTSTTTSPNTTSTTTSSNTTSTTASTTSPTSKSISTLTNTTSTSPNSASTTTSPNTTSTTTSPNTPSTKLSSNISSTTPFIKTSPNTISTTTTTPSPNTTSTTTSRITSPSSAKSFTILNTSNIDLLPAANPSTFTQEAQTPLTSATTSSSATQSGSATTLNSGTPMSERVVCPCTCSYASNKPHFYEYVQKKDAMSEDIVSHLKVLGKDQLAQRRLKFSMENHSVSETCLGGTTFLLCIGLLVLGICATDIVKMASRFKELLINHNNNIVKPVNELK